MSFGAQIIRICSIRANILALISKNKKIVKEWKSVHMEVKVLQALLSRRTTTPNKESSRK